MIQVNDPETQLSILLLGGMDIKVNGAPLSRSVPAKVSLLLVALTLKEGESVQSKALSRRLWPDASPEQAGRYLNRSVWQLRAALGTEAHRLPAAKQLSRSLFLDLSHADVDVIAFDRAVTTDDRPALEQAIALYRGPLLDGIAGTSTEMDVWISQERAKRKRAYQEALRRLADLSGSQGDTDAALDYLRRIVESDPFWEPAQRDLMMALAQSGNVNAALRQYRDLRSALMDTFRREPEAATTALYRQIPVLGPKSGEVNPSPAPPPPPHDEPLVNIPCALTELIGRQEEVSAVADCFKRNRLVTLTGAGGVGKTRLSMQVAEVMKDACADGALFVELEALADPHLVMRAVASALGIEQEQGGNLQGGLRAFFRSKRFLLVLDNCEHLLPACAQLARLLLTSCPDLRILATSRAALGVIGEKVWYVPSLSTPDPHKLPAAPSLAAFALEFPAIQLFEQRALAAWGQFRLSEQNARDIVEICHRLDGIPLAIELAAVRTRTIPPDVMAAQLDEFFRLREGGDPSVMPRQRTLYSLIDWSYRLLSEQEQTLLCRLSAFRGGWTLKYVKALYENEEIRPQAVADLHTRLLNQSLILRDQREEGETRFRMLEAVRAFCLDRLEEAGQLSGVRHRHAFWALSLAESADSDPQGTQRAGWLKALERDHDNMRSALQWAADSEQGELGVRLAAALWRFWHFRGHLQEGFSWLEQMLNLKFEQGSTWHLKALGGAGSLATQRRDYRRAWAFFEEKRRLSEAAGEEGGVAASLASMGNIAHQEEHYAEARELFERSLVLFRKREDRRSIALTLGNLANVANQEKDYALACGLHEESLAVFREMGDLQNVALGLNNMASTLIAMKAFDRVCGPVLESLRLGWELDNLRIVAHCLSNFRGLAAKTGQPYRAAVLSGAEDALRERIHAPVPPKARAEDNQEKSILRGTMGDQAYAAAYACGRAMTAEQAAAFAMEETPEDS